ncbi:hypothetical protein [Streptomyces sp. b94]|uniref:effector-associated constant component EACC1 n=1 Tax=Streptomyces sp. b94 TaxID=1827634 RepID=UPI0035ABC574
MSFAMRLLRVRPRQSAGGPAGPSGTTAPVCRRSCRCDLRTTRNSSAGRPGFVHRQSRDEAHRVGGPSCALQLTGPAPRTVSRTGRLVGSMLERQPTPATDGGHVEGTRHGGVSRSLVTQSAFSAASPALTICAWRRTRPSTPVVTIERNGVRVAGDSDDPADVTRIVRALSSPTPDSHPSSSTPSDAQPPKPPMHFSSTTADTARDPRHDGNARPGRRWRRADLHGPTPRCRHRRRSRHPALRAPFSHTRKRGPGVGHARLQARPTRAAEGVGMQTNRAGR